MIITIQIDRFFISLTCDAAAIVFDKGSFIVLCDFESETIPWEEQVHRSALAANVAPYLTRDDVQQIATALRGMHDERQ